MEWISFREPVNAWTHGAWMLLCIPAGIVLQWQAGRNLLKHIAFAIFSLSLISCFAGSWLYHSVRGPESIDLCARLDYMGIFLLIAGTGTAVLLVLLQGWRRFGLLALIWGIAIAGIVLRIVAVELPDELATGIYIMMGWTGILAYFELARRLTHRLVRPMWIGGLIYSIGAVLNAVQWPNFWPGVFGAHELFHVMVMAASFYHFQFLLRVVAPYDLSQGAEPGMELVPDPLTA